MARHGSLLTSLADMLAQDIEAGFWFKACRECGDIDAHKELPRAVLLQAVPVERYPRRRIGRNRAAANPKSELKARFQMSTNSHVRKRGENSYEIRITKGKDADGDRIFDYVSFPRARHGGGSRGRVHPAPERPEPGSRLSNARRSRFRSSSTSGSRRTRKAMSQQITLEGYKSIIEHHFSPRSVVCRFRGALPS